MSTCVWPQLAADVLKRAEDESAARELSWLLDSLQETLAALKSGLEECYALLAPIEPGSTLVLSSPRSESIKGHVTRIGTRIVKGTVHLRLKTHSPLALSLSPTNPLLLPALTSLRTLLNQSLDCVDITRWTGDRQSPIFISSQFRLLHSILLEALSLLKGPVLLHPVPTPTSSPAPSRDGASNPKTNPSIAELPLPLWTVDPPDPTHFSPPLPPTLALNLTLTDSSLLLTVRVLEPTSVQTPLSSRFALAIGAQRRLEHDEIDDVFTYRGEEVRVREKVRVESSADPSLLVLMAKLGALERTVAEKRGALRVVMGLNGGAEVEGDEEEED